MSKKRFRPLGDIIRMGLIDDGALLRYVVGLLFSADYTGGCRADVLQRCMHIARRFVIFSQYKDQLMAVGRARQTGIEVPGLGILSAGKFEEHAGSKLHRPNQHTLAPSGKSLQVKCLQTWHLHLSP